MNLSFLDWTIVFVSLDPDDPLGGGRTQGNAECGRFSGGGTVGRAVRALCRQWRRRNRRDHRGRQSGDESDRRFLPHLVGNDHGAGRAHYHSVGLGHLSFPGDAIADTGAVFRGPLQPRVPHFHRHHRLSVGHREFRHLPGGRGEIFHLLLRHTGELLGIRAERRHLPGHDAIPAGHIALLRAWRRAGVGDLRRFLPGDTGVRRVRHPDRLFLLHLRLGSYRDRHSCRRRRMRR